MVSALNSGVTGLSSSPVAMRKRVPSRSVKSATLKPRPRGGVTISARPGSTHQLSESWTVSRTDPLVRLSSKARRHMAAISRVRGSLPRIFRHSVCP